MDLAARNPPSDGRLRPLGPDQDGVLQAARYPGEADRRTDQRRARDNEVRGAEQGGYGLPLAGRPDRVDRRWHSCEVHLRRDLRPGLRLCAAGGQLDYQRQAARRQDDRSRQRRLADDHRPDVRRARHRPEVDQVRRPRPAVDSGSGSEEGRRRARLGGSAPPVAGAGPQAEVPDREHLVKAALERLFSAGGRPRRHRQGRSLYPLPAGRRDGTRVHEGQPTGCGSDHLRAAARSAEVAKAAGGP